MSKNRDYPILIREIRAISVIPLCLNHGSTGLKDFTDYMSKNRDYPILIREIRAICVIRDSDKKSVRSKYHLSIEIPISSPSSHSTLFPIELLVSRLSASVSILM